MPPDIDAVFIYTWIAARILYIACVFFIFCGSVFASIFLPPNTGDVVRPRAQRVFAMLFSVSLMGLLASFGIKKLDLDPTIMCVLSSFMGMGAEKVSQWMLDIWKNSNGFVHFSKIVMKIVVAIRKVLKEESNEDTGKPLNEDDLS